MAIWIIWISLFVCTFFFVSFSFGRTDSILQEKGKNTQRFIWTLDNHNVWLERLWFAQKVDKSSVYIYMQYAKVFVRIKLQSISGQCVSDTINLCPKASQTAGSMRILSLVASSYVFGNSFRTRVFWILR